MKPAASIVLFTTVAGAAQGAAVVLAVTTLAGVAPIASVPGMLWAIVAMLLAALAASFFHLGHPLRAWRAAMMWRTSWMSREVIVLPAFIGVVAAWALVTTLAPAQHGAIRVVAALAIAGALLLWYCTAMIYACIRFIQEWAHPLTVLNYLTLGLASGLVTSGAMTVLAGDVDFAASVGAWAIASTLLAWFTRTLSLRRNARLKSRSTVQSATGIRSARVVQKSMGMTGGAFNTREFFHGAPAGFYRQAKTGFQVFAFALPVLVLTAGLLGGWPGAWLVALPLQFAGLLIERWFFFAQANHPQNIYYQTVS